MEMTGLQIFKYLPAAKKTEQSNCKKCGCPTCMAFALKLAKQQINIDNCPYVAQELKEIYEKNTKNAQQIVQIGHLKIGGENVLYRHEKTFINPTVLAVSIDCSKPDFEEKIKEIGEFKYTHVGETFGVDLIILKNADNKTEWSLLADRRSNPACKNNGLPHPFLPNNDIHIVSLSQLQELGLNIIEEQDFNTTKDYLIETRKKAILEKDDNSSAPVCVKIKNDDIFSQCARAGYYICKYANMLVFEEFDKDLFPTLITLRHNIFTDPQKTLQVESGLYKFNEPDENSIIFLTTNFALTFFAVANELENIDTPSYLIVIPAQGMSVLTAWSAETFNAQIVAKTITELKIKEQIKTRKIIIPGLLSDSIEELHSACPDFEFIEGTHEASAIADFVKNNY